MLGMEWKDTRTKDKDAEDLEDSEDHGLKTKRHRKILI
jgi:hypothetical protein